MSTEDTKTPVTITFYGGVRPLVTGIDNERITFIDADAKADLFMVHAGVSIYHTRCDSETVSDYWYALEAGQSTESFDAFDVSDVPAVPAGETAKYDALFPVSEHKEQAGHKRALAYAIDRGWIAVDGWEFPGVDPTTR